MKTKTVHKNIKSKMEEWISTLPAELRDSTKDNIIVTGGCIASMLLGEPVSDYDLYFKSHAPLESLVKHYIKDSEGAIIEEDDDKGRVRVRIPSAGAREYAKGNEGKYLVAYLTENAVTLTDKVQVVTRFIGNPAEIHENYDFIHATNYWTFSDGLVLNKAALASLLTKELIYSGSRYPLCSIIRTRKFIKRGFTINAGQYLKMAIQLNELDLKDISVLRDQLVGVDSAYFEAFISCVDHKMEQDEDLTSEYLCNLADYIFNKDTEIE